MKTNHKDLNVQVHKVVLPGCLLVGLLCYSLISYAQDDFWQQKRSLGLAAASRSEAVSFSIGGKGYAGTGVTSGPRNDFWEYDPVTDVWTQKANVPGGGRSAAVVFSIGNKGYIGLGDSSNLYQRYSDFYEYGPASNAWTRKADFTGGARGGATGFSIGNKGYVGTGAMRGSTGIYKDSSTIDFWEFDPASNVWTQKASFAGTARINASGFSIGEKGYIGLGRNSLDYSYLYNDLWEYDPMSDTWVKKADFAGVARYGAASFSIGDKGYIGTGYGNLSRSSNDFWEYDPTTNAWTQKANYSGDPRELAIGFSIGNKGYLGTGYRSNNEYTYGPKCDIWEYDPALNKWVEKAGLGDGARMNAVTITSKDLSGNAVTRVVTVGVSSDHKDDGWFPMDIKKLIVNILPNPSDRHFTLIFQSTNSQPLNIQVTDIWGRLIEARNNITPNKTLQIGSNYVPGTYYVLVVQGKERLTLRIVKQ